MIRTPLTLWLIIITGAVAVVVITHMIGSTVISAVMVGTIVAVCSRVAYELGRYEATTPRVRNHR